MRLNLHDVNLGHPGLEHRSHFGNELDKSAMSHSGDCSGAQCAISPDARLIPLVTACKC
jgi:hypothetical protein